MPTGVYPRPAAIDRFWAKVDRRSDDECWPWTAFRSELGYGFFSRDGRMMPASRWLLGHLRGKPLSPGEFALHRCDNPPCVNPRHLYVGDHKTNMRDMVSRRRGRNAHAGKTHCLSGHPYDTANTRIRPGGGRSCRTCTRLRQRDRRARGLA